MGALEQQFQRNQETVDRLRRFKRDPVTNQTVMNNCLVYDNGRFRRSNSKYLNLTATPRSAHSSRSRSVNTPSVRLSTSKIKFPKVGLSKPASKQGSKTSLRSRNDSKKSLSAAKNFQQLKAPPINNSKISRLESPLMSQPRTRGSTHRTISAASGNSKDTVSKAGNRRTYSSARNDKLLAYKRLMDYEH